MEEEALRPRFVARALAASVLLVTVYGVALLSVRVASLLFLLYVAVIFAIGLRGLADLIARRTPLGSGPALALAVLSIYGAPVGAAAAFWPQLTSQAEQAREQLPALRERLDDWLGGIEQTVGELTGPIRDEPEPAAQQVTPTQQVVAQLQSERMTRDVVSWVAGFVGGVGQALGGAALVVAVSIFLAAAPDQYERALLMVVPPRRRPRAREMLYELTGQLRAWILGQIAAMALVGVGTTVGLLIAGVQLPLLLGLVAGLLDFIPNFGPALAFLPAALVAAGQGKLLYVVVIYGAVQLLEGWLVRPLIEQRAVHTLPGLLLATQVVLATVFGFMGLLAAPPLLVLLGVLLKRLYVEDTLGDTRPDEQKGTPVAPGETLGGPNREPA